MSMYNNMSVLCCRDYHNIVNPIYVNKTFKSENQNKKELAGWKLQHTFGKDKENTTKNREKGP